MIKKKVAENKAFKEWLNVNTQVRVLKSAGLTNTRVYKQLQVKEKRLKKKWYALR